MPLADISETVRLQNAFFFDLGSRWVLPKFSGSPWDPFRGFQRVPEEELKSKFDGKVARNNSPSNFHVELRL